MACSSVAAPAVRLFRWTIAGEGRDQQHTHISMLDHRVALPYCIHHERACCGVTGASDIELHAAKMAKAKGAEKHDQLKSDEAARQLRAFVSAANSHAVALNESSIGEIITR